MKVYNNLMKIIILKVTEEVGLTSISIPHDNGIEIDLMYFKCRWFYQSTLHAVFRGHIS